MIDDKQPDFCRYNAELPCCYPIDDCDNCPANPSSCDPYWGCTAAQIL
ncbi:MAG: hypothetical protein NC093_08945 [Alistipes sp.]|nr:hypothetical protein [Alistipes sp.]